MSARSKAIPSASQMIALGTCSAAAMPPADQYRDVIAQPSVEQS
jgi:hypothetical protein